LDLIHSDVRGKVGTQSLGGGEYFVTFVDDYTPFVWVYILKHKSEVFKKFRDWKAMVEKSSGFKFTLTMAENIPPLSFQLIKRKLGKN